MKRKITIPPKEYLYFRVPETHHKYKGIRYFRVERAAMNEAVQVVLSPGDGGKGRGHCFGITTISRITLYSNYLAMQYVVPCTKKDFDKAFNAVIKFLQ